jgi:ABC-type dipeptide/oligopeptide/nickel transport system permease component
MEPRKRLHLITAAIMCAGILAALLVYFTAGEPAENPLADQLENSKVYQRSLELYGGKANLLGAQFNQWFAGLWHGRTLAGTILLITALVAGIYYFIASPLPPDDKD